MDNINNTSNDMNEEILQNEKSVEAEATVNDTVANSFENNDTMPEQKDESAYTYGQGSAELNTDISLDDSKAKSKSKLSMILGIISIASVCLCCCFPVGLVLGIISLVQAAKSKKLSPTHSLDGMAIAGIICSIFGIVISFLVLLYVAFVGLAYILNPEMFEAAFEEYMYEAGYTF